MSSQSRNPYDVEWPWLENKIPNDSLVYLLFNKLELETVESASGL
jgi:hypothetical protein